MPIVKALKLRGRISMSKEMIEMTSYCGLYCNDCVRYRTKMTDNARSLLNELKNNNFYQYAEVKKQFDNVFENYGVFIDVLEKIVELECKQSCRKGGGCSAFDCPIMKCCIEKQYEGCWECEQLNNCNKSDFLKPFHGETPKNNCIILHENGLENFALKKQAFYIWNQKK